MAMAVQPASCSLESSKLQQVALVMKSTRRVLAVASSLLVVTFSAPAFAVTTPYSQAQEQPESGMEVGLLNGKIRPCPSDINPNCVSTSSLYGAFSSLPWRITGTSNAASPAQELENAVTSLDSNARVLERTSSEEGDYLAVEVDGFLGRDVLEFLIRGDTVTYRSMAKKVVYVYPLTTPLTDFGRQQARLKALEAKLGWGLPDAYYEDPEDYPYD